MCFTLLNALGPKKRRVFSSLGRYGSDGQSCHVPGASWPSKSSQKCPKGFPFAVPFGVLVRRSRFLCFLCGFLEGPTLDPLAQAQSKRSFSFWAWPLKGCRFYSDYWNIPGTFSVGILEKGTSKSSLKTGAVKVSLFCFLAPF